MKSGDCFCQSKRGPFLLPARNGDHRKGSHLIIENGATLPEGMGLA